MNSTELNGRLENLKSKTTDFAHIESEALKKFGSEIIKDAKDISGEVMEGVAAQFVSFGKSLGAMVRRHPYLTVGSVACLGFVIAKLVMRRRSV